MLDSEATGSLTESSQDKQCVILRLAQNNSSLIKPLWINLQIRKKGSIQKYSVQCVLSMNMLNEKVFLALFYWIIALFFLTVWNLFTSFQHFFHASSRKEFVRRMLSAGGHTLTDGGHGEEKVPLVERPDGTYSVILNPKLFRKFNLISERLQSSSFHQSRHCRSVTLNCQECRR